MTKTARTHLPMTWEDNPAGLGLLLVTLAMLALGVVMVHSAVASVAEPGPVWGRRDVKHTVYAVAAALVLMLLWRVDYRRLVGDRRVPRLLAVLLALAILSSLLVYVPGLGAAVGGRHRWVRFSLGPVRMGFQPSELIKFALVLFLAGWLTRRGTDPRSLTRTFFPAMALTGLCVALVIGEDFGTAMLISIGAVTALFLAGAAWHHLLAVFTTAGGAFFALMWTSPYRWARITAMCDPWDLDNPCAYHARQSLLAIQTGGVFGKGLGHGMIKRGFLPEGHTDFIFSVFCEEWGMVGALLLIGLALAWVWLARKVTVRAGDGFGRTLAGSLGFLIGLQVLLHIAVDLVAAPPTGIGCPFLSAGGTRLLTLAAATSLILSVSAHRPPDAVPESSEPADLAAEPAV